MSIQANHEFGIWNEARDKKALKFQLISHFVDRSAYASLRKSHGKNNHIRGYALLAGFGASCMSSAVKQTNKHAWQENEKYQ